MNAKRKRPAKRRVRPVEQAAVVQPNQPQWARAMQEHFHRTGFYRADDLYRLIGDPQGSVTVTLSTDLDLAGRVSK